MNTFIYFVHGRVVAVIESSGGRKQADRVAAANHPDLERLLVDPIAADECGFHVDAGGIVDDLALHY